MPASWPGASLLALNQILTSVRITGYGLRPFASEVNRGFQRVIYISATIVQSDQKKSPEIGFEIWASLICDRTLEEFATGRCLTLQREFELLCQHSESQETTVHEVDVK